MTVANTLSRPMSRRTFGIGASLSIAALGALRALPTLAHESQLPTLPELTVVAKDFLFDMPATIPAGFTTITLDNQGSASHHAMFAKLNDGVTFEQLLAAPDFATMAQLGVSLGGPAAEAGMKSSVIMNLEEGNYAILCVIPGPDGMPHYLMGMASPFEVTAAATPAASAPKADLKVELMEMMFHNMPAEVPAGHVTWEVQNTGYTTHEMLVTRLSDGVTADMVLEMLTAPPSTATPAADPASTPNGAPPFLIVGGVAPMNPGYTTFSLLDLEAGDYVAICMIPDPETGAPHAAMGMTMPFTVV
jgi:hypothetical protein